MVGLCTPMRTVDRATRLITLGPGEGGHKHTASVVFMHGFGDNAAGWCGLSHTPTHLLPSISHTSSHLLPSLSRKTLPQRRGHLPAGQFDVQWVCRARRVVMSSNAQQIWLAHCCVFDLDDVGCALARYETALYWAQRLPHVSRAITFR